VSKSRLQIAAEVAAVRKAMTKARKITSLEPEAVNEAANRVESDEF